MIWVDAWHKFPNVAWDAYLAFHACEPGGYILFDDIEFNERNNAVHASPDGGVLARYF